MMDVDENWFCCGLEVIELFIHRGPLVQRIERQIPNLEVAGSSPARITTTPNKPTLYRV